MATRLAIIGAGGATGRRAAKEALSKAGAVVGIDRSLPERGDRVEGVDYRQADVLGDDLSGALAGCDAVISTLGVSFTPSNAIAPAPLYTDGTRNIANAMRATEISRLVVISAAFVRPQLSLPVWFSLSVVPALNQVLQQMREMERFLTEESGLNWTAVRPGWLLDKEAGGRLLVGEDGVMPDGAFRCRQGDLARFLVDSAVTDAYLFRTPAVGAPESIRYEGPQAMGCQIATLVRAGRS